MDKNYYEVLAVPSDSSTDRIRRAYLDKVRLVHPDINPSPDAHKEFILLKEAYDILMDENKRMAYDMKIKQAATTKQNQENFHYDFKSNLNAQTQRSEEKKAKNPYGVGAVIVAILIILKLLKLFFILGH